MKFYLNCLTSAGLRITQKLGHHKLDHFSEWAFRKPFDQIKESREMVSGWNSRDREFKIMPGSENKYDLDRMLAIYIRKHGDIFGRGKQD